LERDVPMRGSRAMPRSKLAAAVWNRPKGGETHEWLTVYEVCGSIKFGRMAFKFEIRSDTILLRVGRAKGYHLPDLADAWTWYCLPLRVTLSEPSESASLSQVIPGMDSTATLRADVTDGEAA
jgi:hypothetical protein